MKEQTGISAKKIALIAVMTASVEGAKLALAAIPNVEAVTLLCASYGYVFGGAGLIATSLFVVIETFIYGINTWVLSYAIHWNGVCLIFWILAKAKVRNRIALTAAAVLLTVWFGVLTSLIDIGLFSGTYTDFGYRFAVYYTRGIFFYIVQTVCNLILFPFAFIPLTKILEKAGKKYFNVEDKSSIIDAGAVSGIHKHTEK